MTPAKSPVALATTLAFGAFLTLSASLYAADAAVATGSAPAAKTVTFAKDVAPILQARCQECHRKGAMAPMSLVTYEETRPWAKAIKQRVVTRQMPPWHIDKTVGVQKFKNDMSLTDEQIATIANGWTPARRWATPKDMPAAHAVARRERMESGQGTGPAGSDHQVRTVHHGRPIIRTSGGGRLSKFRSPSRAGCAPSRSARAPPRDARSRITRWRTWCRTIPTSLAPNAGDSDFGARAFLMEWAIGKGYDLYRPDTGKLMLPGSQISWDVHIHAVGEEIRDNVELGIWLYPKGQEPKYRTLPHGLPSAARLPDFGQLAHPLGTEYRHPAEHHCRRPTTTRC